MCGIIYRGHREAQLVVEVFDKGKKEHLPLYLNEINHSPDGFECGYMGSGPAQLAYALLRHATHSESIAEKLHQKFKTRVVSQLPQDSNWEINSSTILKFVGEDFLERSCDTKGEL